MAALGDFGLALLGGQVTGEIGHQVAEQRRIAGLLLVDAADQHAHFLDQIAIDLVLAAPAGTGFGHRFEQLPGRMRALGEEPLILQGHAQQRQLQLQAE